MGIEFRVKGEMKEEVMKYMREREMEKKVYKEKKINLRIEDGRIVEEVEYVEDRRKRKYEGRMKSEKEEEIID